jgi:hypothetical protein
VVMASNRRCFETHITACHAHLRVRVGTVSAQHSHGTPFDRRNPKPSDGQSVALVRRFDPGRRPSTAYAPSCACFGMRGRPTEVRWLAPRFLNGSVCIRHAWIGRRALSRKGEPAVGAEQTLGQARELEDAEGHTRQYCWSAAHSCIFFSSNDVCGKKRPPQETVGWAQ